ncbi:MAG: NUDIX hydrolase [Candidatus Amesbacteria bacterium]|nr:NUDIX hydrolase [Candidatus Amesbacteria bacterium]
MKNYSGVIIIRDDGTMLIQHRDNKSSISNPGKWCIPGGMVQAGEINEDAARREIWEECGYNIDKLSILEDQEYTLNDGERAVRHIYWAIYDGTSKIKCLEGQEIKFLFLNEILDLDVTSGQKELFLKVYNLYFLPYRPQLVF